MNVTVYGDFNSLLSYLASQRADWLVRTATAEIDWRAVEHCRQMPVTGIRSDPGDSGWQRELAETGALALPGERLPAAPPPVVSNTRASVAAYAEAVTDGVEDELRRRLFEAIWAQRRNLSGPYDVRGVIAEVMWPADPIYFHLMSPDLPDPILHDPDPMRIVRREGGTVTPDGGPLTTTGYQRIQQWRQRWLALPQQVIPAVVSPSGTAHFGADGLRFLAGIAGLPAIARDTAPGLPGGHAAGVSIRRSWYYSPGLLHEGLLICRLELGDAGGGEPGVVMVPSGAALVASPGETGPAKTFASDLQTQGMWQKRARVRLRHAEPASDARRWNIVTVTGFDPLCFCRRITCR